MMVGGPSYQQGGMGGNRSDSAGGSKPVELAGDSPELVAFALLRYLAQLEQGQSPRAQLDRNWLLDAYSDCLDAVRGNRVKKAAAQPASGGKRAGARG